MKIGKTTSFAAPALTFGTANAVGGTGSAIDSDATILAFDATDPSDVGPFDAAIVGVATVGARRDHGHNGALTAEWFAAMRLFGH